MNIEESAPQSNGSRKRKLVEESESEADISDLPGRDTQDADGEVDIDKTGDHARGSVALKLIIRSLSTLVFIESFTTEAFHQPHYRSILSQVTHPQPSLRSAFWPLSSSLINPHTFNSAFIVVGSPPTLSPYYHISYRCS